MSRYDDRPYEVGKGKPPKRTQWKPGESGNPSGSSKKKRRSKEMDLPELVRSFANEKITVTSGGKRTKRSKRDMIALRLINDAIEGSAGHRLKAIPLLRSLGLFDVEAQFDDSKEAQQARIAEVLRRLQQEAERDEEMENSFPTR
ncbi:DUF5681 domain-containing protein [Novosphingobium sp. Chol11]|jgi:hypothetical protein|uniref:DUF5681 domain-containing protein n=1 Tax=Novosphingobium sp. Chol11 TaxID=1385763 RepID=UPI0011437F81|nr:DUF5681 domain-containing protein [Novosphingobium sp. Chol11]